VRIPPGAVEQLVAATAERDGKSVRIIIEQEPGAAGSTVIDRYKRHVLRGYNARGVRATGAKDVRASPAAAAAENGLITIVRGRNTNDFLDEICAFPHAAHDDCVDALAGAHQALSHTPRPATFHVPPAATSTTSPNGHSDAAGHHERASTPPSDTATTNTQPTSQPRSASLSTTPRPDSSDQPASEVNTHHGLPPTGERGPLNDGENYAPSTLLPRRRRKPTTVARSIASGPNLPPKALHTAPIDGDRRLVFKTSTAS